MIKGISFIISSFFMLFFILVSFTEADGGNSAYLASPIPEKNGLNIIFPESIKLIDENIWGTNIEKLSVLATFLAVTIALFSEPLKELALRFVQKFKVAAIIDKEYSQIDQDGELKTRLKIINSGWLSNEYLVYIMEIVGRNNFIEVPLVWTHGDIEGNKTIIQRRIDSRKYGWIDFLTVRVDATNNNLTCSLDIGVSAGKTLTEIKRGKTRLKIRIAPKYGKEIFYDFTISWLGNNKHPKVEIG